MIIKDCHNEGQIIGAYWAGGILGSVFISFVSGAHTQTYSIIACYNTGAIQASDYYAGGVWGRLAGDVGQPAGNDADKVTCSITACYNTGFVSGNTTGGILGHSDLSVKNRYSTAAINITACYNIGLITGTSASGAVGGFIREDRAVTITGCFWTRVSDDNNAVNGVGDPPSNTGITQFGAGSAWPANSGNWATNNYWKSLGGWNGGNPVYPKLYFEE
jgi:hypothetical protein